MQEILRRTGHMIVEARSVIKMTQAELAEAADLDPATICRYESGKLALSIGSSQKLASILEMDMKEMIMLQFLSKEVNELKHKYSAYPVIIEYLDSAQKLIKQEDSQ